MARRVVVTGIGCISPVGFSIDAAWDATLRGQTGIKSISLFDVSEYDSQIAGEISDWDPTKFMDRKTAKRSDRFVQFGLAACDQALADCGIEITDDNGWEVGVLIGCGIGGMWTWEQQHERLLNRGPSRVSPFLVPMMIADMAAGQISIRTGAKGPNHAIVSACASATHAIGESYECIRRGDARAVITGGCEGAISTTGLAGFCSAKALSTRNDDPAAACRPFDEDRDGFVIAEGSCILILEELESARSRGAPIYGEIVGYAATADAHNMVAPEPDGESAARAMMAAIEKAQLTPLDVDYINAHAPGTPDGDRAEAKALHRIYDDTDYCPSVNSTKPIHGHMLGATGAMELALSLVAMREGVVPRTVNCENVEQGITLDIVRHENRQARIDVLMSNSFGFGGHNAVVVARRFDQ